MILADWIRFYLTSKTKYQIHSPFISSFITEVLENRKGYYILSEIEGLRELLLQNHNQIRVKDLGAGSKKIKSDVRKISKMAKLILAKPEKIRILFLTSLWLESTNIIELGTGFGLSSIALSAYNTRVKTTTIEGDPETAKIASKIISRSKLKNIEVRVGDFKQQLPVLLNEVKKPDLVLVDGNHTYQATKNYFKQILPYAHENTVIVFDDIYWSTGMIKAWKEICKHSDVAFTIDIFHYGLVFFNRSLLQNKSFKLLKSKWKPLSMGFWH